jgi:hypothetical protein
MLVDHTASARLFRATVALAGLALVMGFLVVLRYSRIPFFVYYPRFTDTVLVSESLDMLLFVGASLCVPLSILVFSLQAGERRRSRGDAGVALAVVLAVWLLSLVFMSRSPSLAVLTLLLSAGSVAIVDVSISDQVYGLERRRAVSEMLVPMMAIFALIEFSPIYYWIFSSVNPGTEIGRQAAELELNLTYSPFLLEPLILLALLSSWIWVPVILRTLKVRGSPGRTNESSRIRVVDSRTLAASIDLIAIVAIVVFYYPYAAGQRWIVGVDSYINYYHPLVALAGLGLPQALRVLSSTFHEAYVGLLYIAELATGLSPFVIVKYAPLMLAILTSLLTFSLIIGSTKNHPLAVLSAVCCCLWIPTTTDIFCAFQANWAALMLWLLFLVSMLRSTKLTRGRAVYLLLQAVISTGILLIHPWTWGVFVVTLVIFAVVLFLEKSPSLRVSAMSFFSSLALAAPLGVAGMLLAPSIRKDMLRAIGYLWAWSNPARLLLVGGALSLTLKNWGSFLNPLLLVMSLLGAVAVIQRRDPLGRYLLAWILTWSIGSVLAAPLDYYPNHPELSDPAIWRMLLVSPLPILLAFGVGSILGFWRRFGLSTPGREPFMMRRSLVVVGVLGLCGAAMVGVPSPTLKLVTVLTTLALILLLTKFVPAHQVTSILILAALVLIVVNGAFRSLYPLLLDPHNLLGRWAY